MNALNTSEKARVAELSEKIGDLASHLAGVQPLLNSIQESGLGEEQTADSLASVGALTGFIYTAIYSIADELQEITRSDESKAAIEAVRRQLSGHYGSKQKEA